MVIKQKRIPLAYLSGLGHFAIEFCVNSMPILYPLLIITMDLSYAQVGAVAFVLSMGSTVSQPVFGYLSDRWDKRGFLIYSVAWSGLFMGLVGLSTSYWALMLVVGLAAMGSAALHPSAAVVAASGESKTRGASVAIFSVSGSLGTALSPLLVGALVAAVGIRATLALPLVALVFTCFLFFQFRHYPALYNHVDNQPNAAENNRRGNSPILLVLVVLTTAARSLFHGATVTYLPLWLQSTGLPLSVAGTYLSAFMIMLSAGVLAGGALSDRIGRLPVSIASFILLGPAFWLALTLSGISQLILIGAAGFILGLTFPITILLAQEAWPGGIGFATSLALGLGWLPYGLGSWALGALADRTSLGYAMSMLPYIPLLALLMISMVAYHSARNTQQAAKVADEART